MINTIFTNKILLINLTDLETKILETSKLELNIRDTDAFISTLDNEISKLIKVDGTNPIYIMTTPLSLSPLSLAQRFNLITKISDDELTVSNASSIFSSYIRMLDYDGIIIVGKSSTPVNVFIQDKSIEFEHIHQSDENVDSIINNVKDKFSNKASILTIGPAAKNSSTLACLINDENKALARFNIANIWADKNLTSLAIKPPEKFNLDTSSFIEKLENKHLPEDRKDMLATIIESLNLKSSEEDLDKFTCQACPTRCNRAISASNFGNHRHFWKFTNNFEENSIKANILCNKLGLDAMKMTDLIDVLIKKGNQGLSWEKPDSIFKFIETFLNEEEKYNEIIIDIKSKPKDKIDLIDSLGICFFTKGQLNKEDYKIMFEILTK